MSIRKEFRLSDVELNYLQEYAETHNCTSTTALKKIIKQHSESSENQTTKFLAKEIADSVCENLDNLLTRLRLGVNNADKNSQIIIELLNSIYAQNPDYFIINLKQKATQEAEEIVRKRIENFRVKRLDKQIGSEE